MDELERLGYVKKEYDDYITYLIDRKDTHDYTLEILISKNNLSFRKSILYGNSGERDSAFIKQEELKAIRRILKARKKLSEIRPSPAQDSVEVLGYILDNRHVASIPRNNINGHILNELCSPLLAIGIRLDWDMQYIYFKAL